MKRFIKKTLFFILLFILIYPVLVIIWGLTGSNVSYSNVNYGLKKDGHMFTRLSEVKDIKDIDVLILGTSHAFRGIDTRVLKKNGFSSFNLGSSSQSPLQTKLLLHRYLDKIKPKMIVYEVTPYFFTTDGVESALNIIGCDKNDTYSLEMALEINNLKVYNTLFYGYFRDLLNLNSGYIEPIVIDKNTYIKGGYVEKELAFFHPEKLPTQEYDYKEQQISAFHEVISIIQSRQIPYILICAPTTHILQDSYTNKCVYDSIMNKSGAYYDFNKILNLNDSVHFYDKEHLNIYGVEIFSERLAELLKEIK